MEELNSRKFKIKQLLYVLTIFKELCLTEAERIEFIDTLVFPMILKEKWLYEENKCIRVTLNRKLVEFKKSAPDLVKKWRVIFDINDS